MSTGPASRARSRVGRANTLRLMELAFALMSARQPVTLRQLTDLVEGYRDADSAGAQHRMFERDKDDLRAIGMEIEVSTLDDEAGYRVRGRDFVLPEIDFTPQERGMLALAGQVWREHALAERSQQGLAKLAASGVELDEAPTRAFQPTLSASEQAFDALFTATLDRRRVRFDYRAGTGEVSTRDIEPWVLGQRGGAWYVVGHDRDRRDKRSFKLSRIISAPQPYGEAGAYAVPEGVDPAEMMAALARTSGDQQAVVAVRGEYAPTLRRRGEVVAHPQTPAGYTAHRVTYVHSADLVAELAPHGADVLVLEPASLRAAMVEHLRRVVAAHGQPAASEPGEEAS